MPSAPLFPIDDETSVIMQPASSETFTKRGPGRPRTKVQPTDVRTFQIPTPGSKAGGPPGSPAPGAAGGIPGSKAALDEAAKKAAAKARSIKELQDTIVKDFNEQLMEALITLNIPPAFLYRDGGSRPMAADSKYTPLGQAICINPMQANWIAHGVVEAKEFPAIAKLTATKEGPSYFWLALGGLGVISYLQGLFTALAQMRKLMAELQAIQNAPTTEDVRSEANPFGAGMNFQEQGPI